jgi:hypothetical protein
MTVEETVKLLKVLHVNGKADVADRLVGQLSTAELRQALTLAVKP